MARQTGFSQYACDRCGRVMYARGGEAGTEAWRAVRRVNADDVDVERLLCPTCAAAWRPTAQAHDAAFAAFMADGGEV